MKKLPGANRELLVFRLMMMTMKERRRYKSDGYAGFFGFVLPAWLNETYQMNKTNRINLMNQRHAASL